MDMKLHIYAQQLNHDSAWIVADKSALFELRDAIDRALKEGNTCSEFYAEDGEGYSLYVVELGEKEMTWEQLDLPYIDRSLMGFNDQHLPHPPYNLITSERHKELRAKLLKNAERTREVSVPEVPLGEYHMLAGDIPTETFKAKARVVKIDRSNTYEGPSITEMLGQNKAYDTVRIELDDYLTFLPGWDGYGAPKFNPETVLRAKNLIGKLEATFRASGDAPDEITACPLPDGRIDLEVVQGTKKAVFTIDEVCSYIEATIFDANETREVREEEAINWFA